METKFKAKDLIKFTNEIAKLYEDGNIKAPIHLGGDNEDQLIEIFKEVKPNDWIFATWRNHYHWLLSGRDPEDLKKQIIDGHSMHVFGKRFFSSAIVGGIAPIAVGVAVALKKKNSTDRVWCFLGDMGVSTGIARESITYAEGHDLPIIFVIEDNGLSVRTNTRDVWGKADVRKTMRYKYKRKWPHAGTGQFVLF